jgi:DNA-binding SARP family transcriptional activator
LVASVLTHVARFRPVVLLIEDIQWMPADDVAAMSILNAALRNEPVLILASMRHETPGSQELRRAIWPITAESIYLSPLRPEEIALLVSNVCGAQVSAKISADLAHASEGLPLRALDTLRHLVDRGALVEGSPRRGWSLSPTYQKSMLLIEPRTTEAITGLPDGCRLLLLLLDCAGHVARGDELARWYHLLHDTSPTTNGEDPERLLALLEEKGMIKPFYADPEQVTFANEAIATAQHERRSADDLILVAGMILGDPVATGSLSRWTHDLDLVAALIENFPAIGTPERAVAFEQIVNNGNDGMFSTDRDNIRRSELFQTIMAKRDRLTPIEQTRLLYELSTIEFIFSRFQNAVAYAEEFKSLTEREPDCRENRGISCVRLALAKFYSDRTVDVSGLLNEAEGELKGITTPNLRIETELQLLKARMTTIPVDRPQDAIALSRRAYQLAEQVQDRHEKYTVLSDLILRVSRLRDEEQLRYYCDHLFTMVHSGVEAERPPLWLMSNAIRAALNFGDIFLARSLFEGWSRGAAPLEVREFVAYSYLTTLFALSDGEPGLAAESALKAREEVLRLSAVSTNLSYELKFNYAALQVYVIGALIATGRINEAHALSGELIAEMESDSERHPDVLLVLRFYQCWLAWRNRFPVDARISLTWGTVRTETGKIDQPMGEFDPTVASQLSEEFRRMYHERIGLATHPPRFIIELLLAEVESAEGRFPEAIAALERAALACEQIYSWRNELEYRVAAVTVRLRWAQSPSGAEREEKISEALDGARDLFAQMSEKGLTTRIEQLTDLFREEAALVMNSSQRDLPGAFERLGSGAYTTAHAVVRNSRSAESGPIEQARLFVMGPLRLMRPHSYMEIADSVFTREAARTLLTALVAAEILERPLTREELAVQLSPKSRTPEGQKKILYNAASAARAACESSNSIINLGTGGMELNTDADREGGVWVDALEVKRGVVRAENLERSGEVGKASDVYASVLALARKGEFAADCYADWADAARDQMREYVRRAALAMGGIALRTGLYAAGIEAVGLQLTRDPFDEEGHRLLIRLQAECGNRSAALQQLEKCRTLILREFGVEPEPETLRLRKEILSGEGTVEAVEG